MSPERLAEIRQRMARWDEVTRHVEPTELHVFVRDLLAEVDRLAAEHHNCVAAEAMYAEVVEHAGRVEAELAEARAELAALQGKPEGALEGWTFDGGWQREYGRTGEEEAHAPGFGERYPGACATRRGRLVRYGMHYEWHLSVWRHGLERDRKVIGYASSPRAAMRAAEAKARELGWLPKEGEVDGA